MWNRSHCRDEKRHEWTHDAFPVSRQDLSALLGYERIQRHVDGQIHSTTAEIMLTTDLILEQKQYQRSWLTRGMSAQQSGGPAPGGGVSRGRTGGVNYFPHCSQ